MQFVAIDHGSTQYLATVELREVILRKPLGLHFSSDELSQEANSFHLACYLGDLLVGCLVLKPLNSTEIQMRQVAIRSEYQGQGFGKALVEYSERFAQKHGFKFMILHSRETAVPFYERLHYLKRGEQFIEVTIPHWEMRKEL